MSYLDCCSVTVLYLLKPDDEEMYGRMKKCMVA